MSDRTLVELRTLATSEDSIEGASRDSLGVPRVAASAVSLVHDPAICWTALEAFNKVEGTPNRPRHIHVYRFGVMFLIEDPDLPGRDEYRALRIFDSRWRYRRTMATF